MSKYLKKEYLLLLFLLVNMTAEYTALMSLSKILFYISLAIALPVVLFNGALSPSSYRKCTHIYLLAIVYTIYQFTFGFDTLTSDTFIYLVSKWVIFTLMVYCVDNQFDFYFKKLIRPMSFIILALALYGFAFHRFDYAGNIAYGFANRNAASALLSIAYAGFLFTTDKFRMKNLIFPLICFVFVLMGGSRNCLAMCIIFSMVRYGLSAKMIGFAFAASILVLFVLPSMGIEITAFTRLEETLSGQIALDREDQREAAMWMISQKPVTGWGFMAQMQGYAAELSELGSHNGYLDHLVFMGIYFGSTAILIIVFGCLKRCKLYFLHDPYLNYHIAVLISVLFAANSESFLTGVNQVSTNLFYVSFVVLGIYLSKYGYNKNTKQVYIS